MLSATRKINKIFGQFASMVATLDSAYNELEVLRLDNVAMIKELEDENVQLNAEKSRALKLQRKLEALIGE